MSPQGEGAPGGRAGGNAARLLLESPLFDAEWYALRTGALGDRAALVEHYLATPATERTSPNVLFDPDWFREKLGQDLGDKDPFLVYLRRRAFATPTHPVFGTTHYRRSVPGAKEHPHGPIAHYVEVGAPAGAVGNRFLPAGPDGRAVDLRAWLMQRHRRLQDPPARGAAVAVDEDVVTVLVPVPAAPRAWRAAWETVTPLVQQGPTDSTRLQVILLDLGSGADDAVKLDVLVLRHPEVEVVHPPPARSAAWRATPVAALRDVAERVRGTVSVVVDHSVEVRPGWLSPLVDALQDDDVAAVQPVVLEPDGTVASAGVVLPASGGAGHSFLSGLPLEDAAGVAERALPAVGGVAVALRSTDLAGLRPAEGAVLLTGSTGSLTACPDSLVVRRGATTLPPVTTGVRWSQREIAAAWGAHGFEVPDDAWDEVTVADPARVLRRVRVQVHEAPPRMRWALKNPATVGPPGELWGDTHFAASLADALRGIGQEVVVDRRQGFDRDSNRHDDVHLLLRGLQAWRPPAHGVSLAWVISHPEDVDESWARAYDRVLAASTTWAQERSRRWGLEVEPLLQASDDRLFHPDRAEPDTGEPVLFVGNARGQYRPIVRQAVEHGLPVGLYGTGWEDLVPASLVRAEYVPNGQVAAAYRAAGVVLNDHWEDMRRGGFLSNRLFDAVASGARVVTDDVAGLGDLFGRSVQVARTPGDLVRLTTLADPDAVFGDDAERRRVAERIRREHSFTARARRLVEVAVQVSRRSA